MKVQYFGDVNDYCKFALLRLLAHVGGFKIGVCWLLTQDDGRTDGAKRAYVGPREKWRNLDPDLFSALKLVKPKPEVSDLLRIESEGLIPGASFFNEVTPDIRAAREAFHQKCVTAFAGRDLVFYDPDNGLEAPYRPKGRKDSSKFVYIDELVDHYSAGRSVLIYQHYPHQHRPTFLAQLARRLSEALPAASVWSFQTAHAVFIAASRPEHAHRVEAVGEEVASKWPEAFVKAHPHDSPEPIIL